MGWPTPSLYVFKSPIVMLVYDAGSGAGEPVEWTVSQLMVSSNARCCMATASGLASSTVTAKSVVAFVYDLYATS